MCLQLLRSWITNEPTFIRQVINSMLSDINCNDSLLLRFKKRKTEITKLGYFIPIYHIIIWNTVPVPRRLKSTKGLRVFHLKVPRVLPRNNSVPFLNMTLCIIVLSSVCSGIHYHVLLCLELLSPRAYIFLVFVVWNSCLFNGSFDGRMNIRLNICLLHSTMYL